MPGASASTQRVRFVNANWRANTTPDTDGFFELLVVTEDDERHTMRPGAAAVSALLQLVRDSPVLLWDPTNRTLIAANLVGEWLPADWTSTDRSSA